MLKILILFTLTLNIAFAKDRFSSDDRKKFLDEVKQEIAEHKVENKGRVDLQIIKPGLYAELEEYLKQEKFTRDEMLKIKQNYEAFSKNPGVSPDRVEEAFYAFIERELDDINKKALAKVAEGNVCNTWSCEDGLKCAPDPVQVAIGRGKKAGDKCAENAECASGECVEEKAGSKVKVCEEVFRCYRPLALGQSCMANPVCGVGICLPYNSQTSGIGECEVQGKSCKKNSDCCSNSCNGGVCKANFICKDCVSTGGKPQRGQKCCEGLYMNGKGVCVPDVPPSVIPQVRVSPIKSIFVAFASFFISTADAGEIEKIQNSFDQLMAQHEDAPVGSTFTWGSGTLKVLPTGNVLYTPVGGGTSVELSEKSNIIKVANKSAELRQNIIQTYGVDPLGTSSSNAANASTLETLKKAEAQSLNNGASTSVNVSGFGNVTLTNSRTEGSGDNQTTIPSSITTASGKTYSPASEFFASNEYAAMTGSKLNADDYKYLAEELEAATKTAQSSTGAKTAAEELEDEEKFLNNGAKNDGLDLKSGIMSDTEKYKNFRAESKQGKALNMDENKAKLVFDKKSNFVTCDIRFRDDFYNGLKENGTMDREIAMLAFDFVMSGEADADYWTTNGNADTSIYARLKKVAANHKLVRADTNKKIENINKKLTCMCIDVQGYNKQTDESKKTFFRENCEEYAKYTDPSTNFDELDGDASGIKAKRLLTVWTSNLSSFYASLTIDNNEAYTALNKVSGWASSEAKWRDTKTRKYELFKFNIKNPSGSVAGLGALIGALLAAGVIAILGGFATTSILSTWMTAGIITASAATGAGGLWMIASLKGAWIQVGPQINDYDIPPRSYSCGKKETCMEYTRTLVQPYNDICKIHASASACLKAFTVISEDKESRYIVDPWIPAGVSRNAILSNQPVYAEKIEEGFQAAKNAMIMKNPGATGGGGKKGGGNFVSELYLSEVFIDANILGSYLPRLGQDLEKTYFMNRDKVKLIKDAAKAFAISEGFLKETETANLEAFANYAYEYHFLWPKKSNPEEISYPTIGLLDYLRYMAVDISGTLTTGLAKETISLNKLNAQYLKDYLNNLKLYADKPTNQLDAVKKALLAKEIDKTQKALDNLLTMNALIDNSALDGQLSNLSSTTVAEQSKLAGANGSANFSTDQANFLKAVGNLRASRKEQLKALDTYNKAMASNGDKERTAKMAATSKKFSKSFATGNSSFGSGSSLFAGGNSSGSNSDSNAAKKDAKNIYGAGSNSGYGTSGTGALFGGGSGSSSSSSSNNNTADSGSGSGSGSSAASSADQDRLADAIDARNKNKDKYQSKDGQSLFEQVTNAYIRNYDKVLIRKKDKDVIEDKR
nr:hypothetical protein BHI3_01760 [Bacteriovorax sp. HI3]